MALHIGIDLGTSGCRAIAIHANGEIVGEARTSLPPSRQPAPGHFEQNPEEWWQATLTVLERLLPPLAAEEIDTLCVDGTSSTLLLCDEKGIPLTQGLMYNDRRSTEAAGLIKQLSPSNSGARGSASSAAKLKYLSTQQYINNLTNKKIFALHQADWISNRLCREWGESDENNCLKLGYDPISRSWPEWISQLDLPGSIQLPHVGTPGSLYGTLDSTLAQRWELSPHSAVKICRGTTDSIASTLAAGAAQPGDAVTTLGTTLVLKIVSDTPLFSPDHGIYSHRLGDRWLISGASNAGAGVLLDHFSVDEISRLSKTIDPATTSKLDYYPLPATGERFPTADPDLPPRLTPIPDSPTQFLHGMLEGLSRIEQQGYQKMVELGAPPPRQIQTTGGGAVNPTWSAIRQRLLPCPVSVAPQTEAAYGSAQLPLLKLMTD